MCLGCLVERIGHRDHGTNIALASDVHQQGEMGWRVHAGANDLGIVEIKAAHVEGDSVPTECTGDDPTATLAQRDNSPAHQVSCHNVEHDGGQAR